MKVKENITVYQCEFCNKKLFVKQAMQRHEYKCFQNPNNDKACYYCIHSKQVEIEVPWDVCSDYHEDIKKVKSFHCEKLDKLMFPYSIERRKLHEKYSSYTEQEPMPNICEFQYLDTVIKF